MMMMMMIYFRCDVGGRRWKLGLVKQQGSLVNELFESRERAEQEAARARASSSSSTGSRLPRNRLHVSSLVTLLEERLNIGVGSVGGASTAGGSASARELAEKYGMDVEQLESLVRFVNVPSVREDEGVRRYVRGAQGGEDVAITEVSFLNLFFLCGKKGFACPR